MCLYPLKCILLCKGPFSWWQNIISYLSILGSESHSQVGLACRALFSVSVLICWICIVRSTASGKWLSFPGETTYILNSHILWMSQLSQCCCLFQSWHVCSYLSSGIWLCFWHFLLLLRSMHPQIPKFKRETVDPQSLGCIFTSHFACMRCSAQGFGMQTMLSLVSKNVTNRMRAQYTAVSRVLNDLFRCFDIWIIRTTECSAITKE